MSTAEIINADPAARPVERLFRYSTWVHVGPSANECADVAPDAQNCSNPLHFHAWCRLPNQFQHREIRLKALAAKAARTRQLRDQGTDAFEILESELDELRRAGEVVRDGVIDELMSKNWWREYLEAMKDVREDDMLGPDDQEGTLYEHIEQDQRRLAELTAMDEDKRPADEYAELQKHVIAYHTEVARRHAERTDPEREALKQRSMPDLIDLLREDRIAAAANDEFTHVYNSWQWLVGTLTAPRGERIFTSLEALQELAPEVVDVLQEAFDDLEKTATEGGVEGNA